MSESLTDYFRQKAQSTAAAGIDWNQRRAEWVEAVNLLYTLVSNALSEPVSQGVAQISRRRKQIVEEHLGAYEVDELVLLVGDEQVIFSPKGRNIVGAAGRVDVRGEAGEAMFVVQPGSRWCVVESKYPTLKTVPLDPRTLEETLHAVMRR